jgi:hypothetical protein
LISNNIEKVVIDRIAHIVLRYLVRPDIDNMMLFDNADDGPGYVRRIVVSCPAASSHKSGLDNAKHGLRVFVALDDFRDFPTVILPRCPASAPMRQIGRVEEGRISGSS